MDIKKLKGCITAMVTPFDKNGEIDLETFKKISEFQVQAGASGILLVGTTGESPTLDPEEHVSVIQRGQHFVNEEIFVIGGTGSNNTLEALEFTKEVTENPFYVDAVLFVDPYYNKPTSQQLRKYYYETIASEFPELPMIPYVIPGRTGGTGLLPEDLCKLVKLHRNVIGVKDATGDEGRAVKTRDLLPKPFCILSGDDSATFPMMTNSGILANGVISVISNIFPGSIQKLTELIQTAKIDEARNLEYILMPLFNNVVTVKTETSAWPNPCGIKTLMAGLGMIDISMRPPLGPMEPSAVEQVRQAILETIKRSLSSSSDPIQKDIGLIEDLFQVDIVERISDKNLWKELSFNY